MRKKIIKSHQPLDDTDVGMCFFKTLKKKRSLFQKEEQPVEMNGEAEYLTKEMEDAKHKELRLKNRKKIGKK